MYSQEEEQNNARKTVEALVELIQHYSGNLKQIEYERRVPLCDAPLGEGNKIVEDLLIELANEKLLEYTKRLVSLIDPSKVTSASHPKDIVERIKKDAGIIKEIELQNKFEPLPDTRISGMIQRLNKITVRSINKQLQEFIDTLVSSINPIKVTAKTLSYLEKNISDLRSMPKA
jgi:hypothetical protein